MKFAHKTLAFCKRLENQKEKKQCCMQHTSNKTNKLGGKWAEKSVYKRVTK